MNDKLTALRELAIPFPIPASFRRQAKAYASQYFTPAAQERVYLNTLAVLVADAYLRLLGFETNLTKQERWNAAHRLWSEANELELSGLGNLECCVIATGQESIIIPSESLSDAKDIRIGYLFVEIASSQQAATLIGFLPAVHPEITDAEVALADLQSMDDLADYLAQAQTTPINDLTQEFAERKITYLRNWLNNIYTAEWEPSMRDLRGATCKKKLDLAGQVFELQLSVSQSDDELMLVRVIVQGENTYLPRGMQVSVPDESDIYTETVNEVADLISIPLELLPGEEFWVELRLGEASIREYFIA
ncbi:DUF1822 family protein [Anabaena subtropica]|uniref:DUF1822 family protein n=1 Tax=Anabaena subtropica FACHB-260 TaxID=2692884 RepID=A0ABR8CLP1_9NOST|nr:DUF1822 family protein [Anabaena subtropica]MBD2344137.1 DUF1822 family protein [Anabaena subtropica FACHB-260]